MIELLIFFALGGMITTAAYSLFMVGNDAVQTGLDNIRLAGVSRFVSDHLRDMLGSAQPVAYGNVMLPSMTIPDLLEDEQLYATNSLAAHWDIPQMQVLFASWWGDDFEDLDLLSPEALEQAWNADDSMSVPWRFFADWGGQTDDNTMKVQRWWDGGISVDFGMPGYNENFWNIDIIRRYYPSHPPLEWRHLAFFAPDGFIFLTLPTTSSGIDGSAQPISSEDLQIVGYRLDRETGRLYFCRAAQNNPLLPPRMVMLADNINPDENSSRFIYHDRYRQEISFPDVGQISMHTPDRVRHVTLMLQLTEGEGAGGRTTHTLRTAMRLENVPEL